MILIDFTIIFFIFLFSIIKCKRLLEDVSDLLPLQAFDSDTGRLYLISTNRYGIFIRSSDSDWYCYKFVYTYRTSVDGSGYSLTRFDIDRSLSFFYFNEERRQELREQFQCSLDARQYTFMY